ncbi:MAG: DUF2203 domain-containing protein [Candidatus Aenigmarchaeota archaeon]|nr:DUF2203 domain-containing protein [Candidatus Aenigmarchaeota archaeon]
MEPELKPRIFTIDEANSLVPLLEKTFDKVFELSSVMHILSKDLRDLVNVWGDSIFSEKNPDNKYYKELLSKRDEVTEIINRSLNKLHSLGCIIKDVDKGLVDFYHRHNSKTVFLCWRYGEKKIQFWHDMSAGFIGRRNVEDLVEN